MHISPGELRQLAPQAHQDYLDALQDAATLQRAGITTPLRLCHFLAQTAHETGGYSIVREATNWTPAQMCALWPHRFRTKLDPRILACKGDAEALANLAYSGRKDLGNVEGDDGWAYRGGGFLQLTGRAAYNEAGAALGLDLEGYPENIEDAVVSLNCALWVWSKHNLNRFADRNYGRAIGNAINRGSPYSKHDPIGVKSRAQWFERAWNIFGDGKLPAVDELALGAYGAPVERLQGRLRELGYPVGDTDAVFGPTLARAVAAFKLDASVTEPAELVGVQTWAALDTAAPVQVSAERASATVHDLVGKGSSEARAGLQAKGAGRMMFLGGLAEGGRQLGVLDQASSALSSVSAFQSSLVPVIGAVQWGLKHAFWICVVLAGIWYWHTGHQVVMARLRAHVQGWNLWR